MRTWMRRRAPRRLIWTAAACLAAGPAARAAFQDPPAPTFRADASYVRIDVFPTLNGAPVTDLGRDEVELFEDRVPQRIDAFEHVVTGASRAVPQGPRARVFVVFLDTHHVDAGGARAVRQ